MIVRAKFKLESVKSTIHTKFMKEGGSEDVEMRTLSFRPVYGEEGENKKFWDATPSGSLELGTINPEAWEQFELGEEYYLDFTKAGKK